MIEPGLHALPDGRAARVVEVAAGGVRARVATLGAALLELWVPGPDGPADVVLGHAALAGYADDSAFLGMAVGPAAGRVAGAQVTVDGKRHALDANDGPNTLHSGPTGLHSQMWTVEEVSPDRVALSVVRPDGMGGFPGPLRLGLALSVAATASGGVLALDWTATSDRPTPVAVTHHAYYNLDGHDAGTVRDHVVQSDAGAFVALGPGLVPTGKLAPVAGTPFNFRAPVGLGRVLDGDHRQLDLASGLDHDLVDGPPGERHRPLRRVATARARIRAVEVWTTEPGVHLYAGGFLDVEDGKGGARYGPGAGLALETQPPPDATAHPGFPDTVLRPGRTFRSRTEYRFSSHPPA